MHITVAICTWNRAKLLDQTLTQMRNLRIPEGVTWELLVVNNNSPDDTDAVLERYAAQLPLRRLLETKQGLSHARNCVLDAATGELILWTDDDVLVDPEWLAAYVEAARRYPDAGCFGGPIQPWFESDPPQWARAHLDVLAPAFVIRTNISPDALIEPNNPPWGANMAFRRSAISAFRFDPRFGRSGRKMRGAEESLVFQRLLESGVKGRWVAGAVVQHFVESMRVTPRYVYRSFHGMSETAQIMEYLRSPEVPRRFPRWFARMWIEASLVRWLRSRRKDPRWFSALRRAAVSHGRLTAWWEFRDLAESGEPVQRHPAK